MRGLKSNIVWKKINYYRGRELNLCHGEEEKKISNVARDFPPPHTHTHTHTLSPSNNRGSGPAGVKAKEASVNRKYMCNRKSRRHSKSFLLFGFPPPFIFNF